MRQGTVDPVDMFFALVGQADIPNGLVALLFLILVVLAALILLAIIIAVAHDEEVWKQEREQLMLENATLLATIEAWRNNSVQCVPDNQARPTGQGCEAGFHYRKAKKKMSKLQEAKQMIGEVGLLRTLMMISLVALFASMVKTSWDRIKYHFEE